jgi:hypothetical protein
MPIVDPPSRPRNAIVFSLRAFASSSAPNQILRFSGSSQADEHIARLSKRCHLTRKNFIEPVIIRCGSQNSAIACETNRRKRAPIVSKTYDQLRREMGCVSRAAAVPAHQQFVSRTQTLLNQICGTQGSLAIPVY